jgi:hypothetical protein
MEQSPSSEANSTLSYSKTSPPFMEPEGSLPYLQEPATGPYLDPDESIPQPPSLFSVTSILILSSYLRPDLPNGLFTSDFPTKILHAFNISAMRATYRTHLILLDFIIPIYFVNSSNYGAPHYAAFISFLLMQQLQVLKSICLHCVTYSQ